MGENLSTREVIEELSRQENKAKRNSSEAVEERKEKRAPRQKRRVCAFCMEKDEAKRPLYIDYKDPRLKKYVSEGGKIFPRRQTGLCAAHQRELARAVKVAKSMGLL
ncbi:MAG: 30S ribosomal protein S18 [Clostridia bacterium]|nr:30S ribosomal protein S18 [Clostridia bacterium]